MKSITYSLCLDGASSEEYYGEAACFTDEVIDQINKIAFKEVEDYRDYIMKNKIEKPMKAIVYDLELLMIGVFWRIYIKRALSAHPYIQKTFSKLAEVREKNSNMKDIIDLSRGLLGNQFLLKEKSNLENIDNTIDNLQELIQWLKASGEFIQEAKRMEIWAGFLSNKNPIEVNDTILKAIELGQWFERRSNEVIGRYTENIDNYIEQNQQRLKGREDIIFCSQERVLYHLNMVGAEMMNRGFREDFLTTKEKLVLLPVCMRYQQKKDCKSVKTDEGFLCIGCSIECNVNQIASLGRHEVFKTYIIPHTSAAFSNKRLEKGGVGIVGIACVLNLISGGFKAKELGFEPQCVLLNYCGCKKHWHEKGIITEISLERLKDILEINEFPI